MALMESVELKIGSEMPDFRLADAFGKKVGAYDSYGAKGLLLVFTCNHCPYALAVWPRLIRLAAEAKKMGITTLAVNPNIHPDYPDDAPERMAEKVKEWKLDFPYLVDETQQIADRYDAQCTPDIYLMDGRHQLVYHGRIDDNWKDEAQVKRHDLKLAIENLAKGKPVEGKQFPSMGCSIKWRE